jgi:hypothetical protein
MEEILYKPEANNSVMTPYFDFASYVTMHQQAHQDLTGMGEPVPENKMVHDFLNGITDPQCANIKVGVLCNLVYMNDFLQTINFCASTIDLLTKSGLSSITFLHHDYITMY